MALDKYIVNNFLAILRSKSLQDRYGYLLAILILCICLSDEQILRDYFTPARIATYHHRGSPYLKFVSIWLSHNHNLAILSLYLADPILLFGRIDHLESEGFVTKFRIHFYFSHNFLSRHCSS